MPPHNHDSLAYQIPRIFGYLSQGTFEIFRTNYWAQVTQPHGPTSFYIWIWKGIAYLPLLQGFSLLSIVAISISSFHIIGQISTNRNLKYFALIANFFVVETLLISTTTQTDIIQTAILFTSISLIRFIKSPLIQWNDPRIAIVFGIMILLLTAIKATFAIYTISLFPFFWKHLLPSRMQFDLIWISIRNAVLIASIASIGIVFGYKDNFVRYGSPIGPTRVLKEHTAFSDPIWISGSDNLIRFTFDTLTLDGLPVEPFKETNRDIKKLISKFFAIFSNHYLLKRNLRGEFFPDREQRVHEDFSYGGIWGIILFLSSLYLLIKRPNNIPKFANLFLYSAILYFVINSFLGPYDPWRGRYFSGMFSLLIIPVSLFLFSKNTARWPITVFSLILTATSLYVLINREGREYIGPNSAFKKSFNTNTYAHKTDYKVIADSIYNQIGTQEKGAVIGTCIPEDIPSLFLYKYQGYPENKVVVIQDFADGISPHLLKEVNYIFFHETCLQKEPLDTPLPRGFFFRKTLR
ncbi:hypothetical protein JWG40_09055 [Leptospira sp. 201903074]|uniref:hypothetical protein n=1 Tax=Leptospira abararensis TaxID=2810036 RepID=UPI0019638A9D|nr:hypothetical protein [Leptospira abararensis]MBM9547161.1 hypothetical protein [Leptospira abararensis]